MAERFEIYKCEICGNIVEVLDGEAGALVCCGDDMKLMVENTTDGAVEKHVPVPHRVENGGIKVAVGEVPHPMTEEHYIEWVEMRIGNRVQRKYLNPGDDPAAVFVFPESDTGSDRPIFREYCNLHGLWKSEG